MISYKVFLGYTISQKIFCRGHTTYSKISCYLLWKWSHCVKKGCPAAGASSCMIPFCSLWIWCQALVAPGWASLDQTTRGQFSRDQAGRVSLLAASVSLGMLQRDGRSTLSLGNGDILISEGIWCEVQCWPQKFNSVSDSARGWGQQFVRTLEQQSPSHGRGKPEKSNPTYCIWEMRGGREKGKQWWVQTQTLEASILGLKSFGAACPWSRMLWNNRDPLCSPLRGGQGSEIQAYVSSQKDLIGIWDFEVLNPS